MAGGDTIGIRLIDAAVIGQATSFLYNVFLGMADVPTQPAELFGVAISGSAAFLVGYIVGKGRGKELRRDILETILPQKSQGAARPSPPPDSLPPLPFDNEGPH